MNILEKLQSLPFDKAPKLDLPDEMETRNAVAVLIGACFGRGYNAGWWHDLSTGAPTLKTRNVPEILCLIHSEISEAMEGYRKDKKDDHLPGRDAFTVELADAVIRIMDLAGAHMLDLPGALMEKLQYNEKRADHKITSRRGKGGKKF